MQKQKSEEVSLLIREGAGKSNILRIKFSILISNQDENLIKVSLPEGVRNLPEEIGPGVKMIIKSLADIIPRMEMISFRSHQIIFNLGTGNIWRQEEEDAVRELIDSVLTARGLIVRWSIQRRIGQRPKPL